MREILLFDVVVDSPFPFLSLLIYLFIFFLIILSSPSNKYVELVFDDANWLLTIRWENSLEWATHC